MKILLLVELIGIICLIGLALIKLKNKDIEL
jgi:hypothetical protein